MYPLPFIMLLIFFQDLRSIRMYTMTDEDRSSSQIFHIGFQPEGIRPGSRNAITDIITRTGECVGHLYPVVQIRLSVIFRYQTILFAQAGIFFIDLLQCQVFPCRIHITLFGQRSVVIRFVCRKVIPGSSLVFHLVFLDAGSQIFTDQCRLAPKKCEFFFCDSVIVEIHGFIFVWQKGIQAGGTWRLQNLHT